jgi:hypothetical protein
MVLLCRRIDLVSEQSRDKRFWPFQSFWLWLQVVAMLVPLCCDCVPRRALQNVLRVRAECSSCESSGLSSTGADWSFRPAAFGRHLRKPVAVPRAHSCSLARRLVRLFFVLEPNLSAEHVPWLLRSCRYIWERLFVLELVSVDLDGLCRQELVLSASRIPLNIWRDPAVIWTPLYFRFGSFVDSLRCLWSYSVSLEEADHWLPRALVFQLLWEATKFSSQNYFEVTCITRTFLRIQQFIPQKKFKKNYFLSRSDTHPVFELSRMNKICVSKKSAKVCTTKKTRCSCEPRFVRL